MAADNPFSEINYSLQFPIANDYNPIPAPGAAPVGTKPSSTAKAGAALAGGASSGAPGRVLPYVIAAHHPPANNGSRGICGFGIAGSKTSNGFSCVTNLTTSLGHFPTDGVGKKDVAIGAAVVGMAIVVILVL